MAATASSVWHRLLWGARGGQVLSEGLGSLPQGKGPHPLFLFFSSEGRGPSALPLPIALGEEGFAES